MPKDRDEKRNREPDEFSLEEILAEYGDGGKVVPFPHNRSAKPEEAPPPPEEERAASEEG